MLETITKLQEEVTAFEIESPQDLERFKQLYTGRKGQIQALFKSFKEVPKEEKAEFGKRLNALKNLAAEKFAAAEEELTAARDQAAPPDITLPGTAGWTGGRHPLAITQRRIIQAFQRVGFAIAEGPEVEDDWYNFTALNFPPSHPARDEQDTFFVTEDHQTVLRTHTSNVQVRVMEHQRPPIRIIAPGRVYRNEAISARAHCFFHQIEGLHIEKGVSFKDLKQTLEYFATTIFGTGTKVRLRPSYFPFTEISAEMDVSCLVCQGSGCPICKHTGWVEVLGCGMVDPEVLENCEIDPDVHSGYAFGMGIERIALLLFRVPDLRLYAQNDLRFLQQFARLQ